MSNMYSYRISKTLQEDAATCMETFWRDNWNLYRVTCCIVLTFLQDNLLVARVAGLTTLPVTALLEYLDCSI